MELQVFVFSVPFLFVLLQMKAARTETTRTLKAPSTPSSIFLGQGFKGKCVLIFDNTLSKMGVQQHMVQYVQKHEYGIIYIYSGVSTK